MRICRNKIKCDKQNREQWGHWNGDNSQNQQNDVHYYITFEFVQDRWIAYKYNKIKEISDNPQCRWQITENKNLCSVDTLVLTLVHFHSPPKMWSHRNSWKIISWLSEQATFQIKMRKHILVECIRLDIRNMIHMRNKQPLYPKANERHTLLWIIRNTTRIIRTFNT